uniref:Cytokine like 1 n=1 Tax=Catagonus wagneri TaxID=51154 RepID=A0A8C3XCY0_9CETA
MVQASALHISIEGSPRDVGLVRLLDGWLRTSWDQPEDMSLQASCNTFPFRQEPCARYLPRLYLDIHNYCVLAKLRDFVASPQCWKVAQVDALKDRARKLYTIMNSFCRRDLVFLSDDCNALEYPIPGTTFLPDPQRRDQAAQTRDRGRGD